MPRVKTISVAEANIFLLNKEGAKVKLNDTYFTVCNASFEYLRERYNNVLVYDGKRYCKVDETGYSFAVVPEVKRFKRNNSKDEEETKSKKKKTSKSTKKKTVKKTINKSKKSSSSKKKTRRSKKSKK